jgi:hypothetical protein
MARERDFWRNTRGSSFESLALALSVIAVMFVAGADFLNYASKRDGLLARAFTSHTTDVAQKTPDASPRTHNGVDYTATGSIIGLRRPVVLEPCNGTVKQ